MTYFLSLFCFAISSTGAWAGVDGPGDPPADEKPHTHFLDFNVTQAGADLKLMFEDTKHPIVGAWVSEDSYRRDWIWKARVGIEMPVDRFADIDLSHIDLRAGALWNFAYFGSKMNREKNVFGIGLEAFQENERGEDIGANRIPDAREVIRGALATLQYMAFRVANFEGKEEALNLQTAFGWGTSHFESPVGSLDSDGRILRGVSTSRR